MYGEVLGAGTAIATPLTATAALVLIPATGANLVITICATLLIALLTWGLVYLYHLKRTKKSHSP